MKKLSQFYYPKLKNFSKLDQNHIKAQAQSFYLKIEKIEKNT